MLKIDKGWVKKGGKDDGNKWEKSFRSLEGTYGWKFFRCGGRLSICPQIRKRTEVRDQRENK
jgi:hypothetical protein